MKYTLKLFGHPVECTLDASNDELKILLDKESQTGLQEFLKRVLPRYGKDTDNLTSMNELVQAAVDAEAMLDGQMSEPTVKLPYEFQPEVKEKLVKAASIQGISATQLLIRIIEKKYKSIMAGGGSDDGLRK